MPKKKMHRGYHDLLVKCANCGHAKGSLHYANYWLGCKTKMIQAPKRMPRKNKFTMPSKEIMERDYYRQEGE